MATGQFIKCHMRNDSDVSVHYEAIIAIMKDLRSNNLSDDEVSKKMNVYLIQFGIEKMDVCCRVPLLAFVSIVDEQERAIRDASKVVHKVE